MRYTVKYVVNGVINSDAPTDDLSKAIQREAVLRERFGIDNVWIADAVQEILVG
jgi:hypothetical protein